MPIKRKRSSVPPKKACPKVTRHRYKLIYKLKAIQLRSEGMTLKNIVQWFKDNEGLDITPSTVYISSVTDSYSCYLGVRVWLITIWSFHIYCDHR